MGIINEGFDFVMHHSNGQTLALLVILWNRVWHPLLLFWWNSLHLFWCSVNSIYAQARRDRLILHTCDVSKLVGLHSNQHLVWLGWKEVDLFWYLDLWCFRLAWLVLK